MKNNNDFKYDLKLGQEFENKLADIFNNKKIEVKTDFGATKTGNIFVEFESWDRVSGVYKSEADYYCYIVSMDYIIFIKKDVLKRMVEEKVESDGYVRGGDNYSSKGALIKVADILKHSSKISRKLKEETEEE